MFYDLLPGPVDFQSPWENEKLAYRLTEILSGDGHRVAYLYDKPDSSTFRYRVFNMVEALRAAPEHGIRASWFCGAEIPALRRILPRLSTIVITRMGMSQAVGDLIAAAKANGVVVLFDSDDLVFDVRYAQLISVNNDQPFSDIHHVDSWYSYVGRIQAVAHLCDGGIATNRFLADKLSKICSGPVSVVPNFLNKRQQHISRCLLASKAKRRFKGDGRIMLGYFSGSPTHNKDFSIALDAIKQIMHEDTLVDMRIVGFMEGHTELSHFGDRVNRITLQDWVNLQVMIAEVDINIAPLQLNDFTHCKSELKFFEAGIVGSYTLASPSFTFANAINSIEEGMIVNNGDWYASIKSAVAYARRSEKYARNALNTARKVEVCYGWNANTDKVVAAITCVNRRRIWE